MTAMENLGSLWNSIQAWLFPTLEDELGELDEKHREFVSICEPCSPQAYVESYRWVGNAPPCRMNQYSIGSRRLYNPGAGSSIFSLNRFGADEMAFRPSGPAGSLSRWDVSGRLYRFCFGYFKSRF